jgi:hypothetical protein
MKTGKLYAFFLATAMRATTIAMANTASLKGNISLLPWR